MSSKTLLLLAILLLTSAACTHRVEPRRSPFITPAGAGQPTPLELPGGEDAAAPSDSLGADSPTMQALRDLQAARGGAVAAPKSHGTAASAAVEAGRALVAADPSSLEARLALARAYHHERIFDLALEHYVAARELAPADPAIDRDLGRLWVDEGSPELALPYLERALAALEADAETWSYRGIALDLLSRYPEAEGAFRRSIELESRRWDFFNNLGFNLLLQERHPEAAAAFRSGLVLAPGHPVLQNNLGLALGLQGETAAALEAFRTGGSEADAWNNLGVVHRARREDDLAAQAFERAFRLDAGSRSIARNVRESRLRAAIAREDAVTETADAAGAGMALAVPALALPASALEVAAPVNVAARRDAAPEATAPAPETPAPTAETAPPSPSEPPARRAAAPTSVEVLPVTLPQPEPVRSPRWDARAAAPPVSAEAAPPPAPPEPEIAPVPVRLVSGPPRLGTSSPSALPAPRSWLPADAAATRGHRLELLRSPYEDLAVKSAAQFSRVTGIAARVNQSGRVYMVQVGRDLTLAEAWRLRDEALREGYDDARVRDAGGRDVAAPVLSPR